MFEDVIDFNHYLVIDISVYYVWPAWLWLRCLTCLEMVDLLCYDSPGWHALRWFTCLTMVDLLDTLGNDNDKSW